MTTDEWRQNSIYRAIMLIRQHSRACRGMETREMLLLAERDLLKLAAMEGLCQGVEDCSIVETCQHLRPKFRSRCEHRCTTC